jgi:glutamine cyclotransferase
MIMRELSWRRLAFFIFLAGMLALSLPACRAGEAPPASPSLPPPSPTVLAPSPTSQPEDMLLAPIVSAGAPVTYTYRVVNTYPHDPEAFTQGLVWEDGVLYEGTGLYGRSSLRRVELETGVVQQQIALADDYFGEGITLFDGRIIQLTWRSGVGFVYDPETFAQIETFTYPTEGWGVTHDGRRLIVSDGAPTLYFWDPETFQEIGRVPVAGPEGPVARLNELEYIDGEVWANVWLTDRIARIDPLTGQVAGWIDLSGLLSEEEQNRLSNPSDAVLNGIAYDAENGRIFVTGKLWPKLFEIEVIPVDS